MPSPVGRPMEFQPGSEIAFQSRGYRKETAPPRKWPFAAVPLGGVGAPPRVGAGLGGGVGAFVGGGGRAPRGALPRGGGGVRVPGAGERVEIARGGGAIPPTRAGNRHDLFFAQGYVQASERLFQ